MYQNNHIQLLPLLMKFCLFMFKMKHFISVTPRENYEYPNTATLEKLSTAVSCNLLHSSELTPIWGYRKHICNFVLTQVFKNTLGFFKQTWLWEIHKGYANMALQRSLFFKYMCICVILVTIALLFHIIIYLIFVWILHENTLLHYVWDNGIPP